MTNGLIDQGDPLLRDETGVALATLVSATGSTAEARREMIVGRGGGCRSRHDRRVCRMPR
jgi:hypothetical protein